MTQLNLTNQQAAVDQIQPYINALKTRMLDRKELWDKINIQKRKQWVLSDKDPIMSLAWSIYKWLDTNFFGDEFRQEAD
jgi:hypothetical protein